MTTEDTAQPLIDQLFSDEAANVFAVLDGASVGPALLDKLYGLRPEFECLYRGELAPDIAEVAPYLVHLEPGSEFAQWLVEQGWGKHWGVYAVSEADLRKMRRHFRTFLTVYNSEGKPLLFRYYDPRVLRLYLPTCNAEELATLFGPVSCYMLEDEDPTTLLRFSAPGGELKQERRSLEPEQ